MNRAHLESSNGAGHQMVNDIFEQGVISNILLNGHDQTETENRKTNYSPRYKEYYTDEDQVESQQGHQLEKALKSKPYPSKEIGADWIVEGRVIPFDVYTIGKRSDSEVKFYKEALQLVDAEEMNEPVLSTLLARWVTPLNISELLFAINFSEEDVKQLRFNPNENWIKTPRPETYGIDSSAEYYQRLLDVIADDDIKPLVVMKELISKVFNKPSLQQVIDGLTYYYARKHFNIRRTNHDPDDKSAEMKIFEAERRRQLEQLSDHLVHKLKLRYSDIKITPSVVASSVLGLG